MHQTSRKRLLFVDDEQGIRLTLPPILAKNGFEVTSVANVPDAIIEIERAKFDILLSDLNLPYVNSGFIVIEQMRRSQPACVNFILTGFPADDSFKRAREYGVAHYFVKPMDIEEMLKTIQQKMDAHYLFPTGEPTAIKYPWQQAVLDAVMELQPESLPSKIAAAEVAISSRLTDRHSADLDERIALHDALRSLRVLFPEDKKEPAKKKDTA